jgi:hypothetical protein
MDCRDAPGEIVDADPLEAGGLDHAGEAGLVREAADRLDEVAVGLRVPATIRPIAGMTLNEKRSYSRSRPATSTAENSRQRKRPPGFRTR